MSNHAWQIALAVFLCVVPAWGGPGGGTEIGNGANVIILPDDTVILADPYVLRSDSSDIGELDPGLRGEIDRAGRLLIRLGAAVSDPRPVDFPRFPSERKPRVLSRSGQARFIVDYVLNRKVEYHFVSALPFSCRGSGDVTPLPGGATTDLVACTVGPATYIRKDYFRRMTVREQAKLIVHERLHALPGPFPHEYLADVTDGLELLLALSNDQFAGKRPVLTDRQVEVIQTLIRRLVQMELVAGGYEPEFEFADQYIVFRNGGGLVHRSARLGADVYIGAGSLLTADSMVGDGATVIHSSCYLASCDFGAGTLIQDTVIEAGFGDNYSVRALKLIVGGGVQLKSSRIIGNAARPEGVGGVAEIYEGARLLNSSFLGIQRLLVGSGASAIGAMVSVAVDPGLELGFTLQEGASLRNVLAPLIFGGPKMEARSAEVSVAAGAVVDFGMEQLCERGSFAFLKGNLTIGTREDLRKLCADRF